MIATHGKGKTVRCAIYTRKSHEEGLEQEFNSLDAQLDREEDLPTERDMAEALRTIEPLWAELFPAEKERIARLLETVTVRPDGLTIRLRPTGMITLAGEVAPETIEESGPEEGNV